MPSAVRLSCVLLSLAACASDDATQVPSGSSDSSDSSGGESSSGVDRSSTSSDAESSTDSGVDTTDAASSSAATSESETGTPTQSPMTNDDDYFTVQDGQLVVGVADTVVANDVDDGMLTVIAADALSDAGVAIAVTPDGQFDYSPPAGFWGRDGFDYTVADLDGNEANGRVTLHVAPSVVPLVDVAEGHGGFAIDGVPELTVGAATASGGDFDGDGVGDLLIGAPGDRAAYLVLGGELGRSTSLSALVESGRAIRFEGELMNGSAGAALDFAGDVDGDGLDDLMIADVSQTGRVYIVLGTSDPASTSLATIANGEGGFVVTGNGDHFSFGFSVSRAGDVNGDGLADVVIGTLGYDSPSETDNAYVVFGKADTDAVSSADLLAGDGGFAIIGEPINPRAVVGSGGDLDGDGFDDLVVSAPLLDGSGRAYVVFGKDDTDAVLLADVVQGTGGFAMDDLTDGTALGWTVDGVGDVNGDDIPDVAIGALAGPGASTLGRTYVVFGTGDRSAIDLADIADGVGGFVVDGAVALDRSGVVAAAGDVDADGLADLAISTYTAGSSYIVYGKADGAAVDLAALAVDSGYTLVPELGDDVWRYASAAGDVDGDGTADVMIGMPFFGAYAGRVSVVYGVRTQ
ncbi:MAG TPA: Ig-like domain-containing protein [Nannocystaceae bacterium]|nr:Ig-like domain-containing protein [Nannocystaceae bacterium]